MKVLSKVISTRHIWSYCLWTDYSSYKAVLNILDAMSKQIDQEVSKKVKKSPVITIITDESTNIMVQHKLVINCHIIEPTTLVPSTLLLTDIRITSATGNGLFSVIEEHLRSRSPPVSIVTALGTDGATMMTGRKEGLMGHFLQHNPHILNCHWAAHRLALVSEQAAMKESPQTLGNIYYHFFQTKHVDIGSVKVIDFYYHFRIIVLSGISISDQGNLLLTLCFAYTE